jgi:hypothetical protein
LGVIFVVVRWDHADKFATGISAIASVAAVGVAVWAALPNIPERDVRRGIRVSGTPKRVSGPGGHAVTGVRAGATAGDADVVVEQTGDADASAGGDAITGIDLG